MCLAMILTFIIGSVFSVAGVIAQDGVPVINYLFSNQNLLVDHKIISDGEVGKYINTCMNDDGDLGTKNFNLQDQPTKYVESLYTASSYLNQMKQDLTANSRSVSINQATTTLSGMKDDITLTMDPSATDSVYQSMRDFRSWTDSSVSYTKQKGCSSTTTDQWVSATKMCDSGFAYSKTNAAGSNSCLMLSDWNDIGVSNRYLSSPACPNTSTDFSSFAQAINAFYSSLNNYNIENTKLINSMLVDNDNLDKGFQEMSRNLLNSLNKMDNIITPLLIIYDSIIGKNSIFSLINCSKYILFYF